MKVLLDHQCFVVQPYGGFTRYYVSLLRALRTLPDMQCDVVAPAHVNEYLGPHDAPNAFTFRLRRPRRGLRFRPALMAPLFRAAASWLRPDVIHETHYALQGTQLPRGVPVMATCHDMIVERHDDGSEQSARVIRLKRQALERADGIICISESTRADLLDLYPALESRVSVVHHGVEAVQALDNPPMALPESFLLYVGVRTGYKNFANLVRALGALGSRHADVHLVCFGGGALRSAELQLIADAGLPAHRVHQLGGDDSLLASLYRRAVALVYPSLQEGFGMPLTEAMAQGCPVLCGSVSCCPEICAEAAEYFDPLNIESMRAAIDRLLQDESRRATLRQLGFARAAQFSWQHCAQRTAAAYRRIVG